MLRTQITLLNLFDAIEYLPCPHCTGEARNQLKFVLPEHLHSKLHIFEEFERSHLIIYNHPHLVHPAAHLDICQHGPVEFGYLWDRGLDALPNRYYLHGIHNLGDINFLRTSCCARLARCTEPHCSALENEIVHAESNGMD